MRRRQPWESSGHAARPPAASPHHAAPPLCRPPLPPQLNETPSKAITWAGLGVVAAVTAGFVVVQQQHKRRGARRAAAAAAAADEEAGQAAPAEGGAGEAASGAGAWGSFISHGASFLRGPRSFVEESAASFRRRQLRGRTAPARVSFMEALGRSTDTGYSPELLLDSDDLSDDGKEGVEGCGDDCSPCSTPGGKPAS